jgi:hypothetical protein
MRKNIILLLSFLLLVGCFQTGSGSGLSIGITGTRFSLHQLKGNERGNIFLLPTRQQYQEDLIYKNYEKLVSEALQRNGLRVTRDEKTANYVGLINYGFVTQQSSVSTANYKINNRTVSFESENYPINPTRGKIEYDIFGKPLLVERFDRVLEFYLYEISDEKSKQILYSKLSSTGACNNINSVAEDLTTMLFLNYPPKNNETEKLTNFELKVGKC